MVGHYDIEKIQKKLTESALQIANDLIRSSSIAGGTYDNEVLWKEVRVKLRERGCSQANIELYEPNSIKTVQEILRGKIAHQQNTEKLANLADTEVTSLFTSIIPPKGKTMTKEHWECFRPVICCIYLVENLTFIEIQEKLRPGYNFYASRRSFLENSKRWRLNKGLTISERDELLKPVPDGRGSANTTYTAISPVNPGHTSEYSYTKNKSNNTSSNAMSMGSIANSTFPSISMIILDYVKIISLE
ncbi:hypothetical protein ACMFMG_007918 [Clarireedia jacksonii]